MDGQKIQLLKYNINDSVTLSVKNAFTEFHAYILSRSMATKKQLNQFFPLQLNKVNCIGALHYVAFNDHAHIRNRTSEIKGNLLLYQFLSCTSFGYVKGFGDVYRVFFLIFIQQVGNLVCKKVLPIISPTFWDSHFGRSEYVIRGGGLLCNFGVYLSAATV